MKRCAVEDFNQFLITCFEIHVSHVGNMHMPTGFRSMKHKIGENNKGLVSSGAS